MLHVLPLLAALAMAGSIPMANEAQAEPLVPGITGDSLAQDNEVPPPGGSIPGDSSWTSSSPKATTTVRDATLMAQSHQGGHFRLGLQANNEGLGLQAGGSGRTGHVAGGIDFWARPGAWLREVHTSPTRRTQYKEFLFGFVFWAQGELDMGRPAAGLSPLRLAGVAGLEWIDAKWYGTTKGPDGDIAPSLGLKILAPRIFQLGLRYAFGRERLVGAWRGEAVCEF